MASANTIAPSAGAALVTDRLPQASAPQVVATELSPPGSVTAAADAFPSQNDMSSSDRYQHTVILDPPTRDLIFRIIDVRSGQVVRQVPDEALLRIRAYARALVDGRGMTEALTAADLECYSAWKIGSDSLLMKFGFPLCCSHGENQHHAACPSTIGACARWLCGGERYLRWRYHTDHGTPYEQDERLSKVRDALRTHPQPVSTARNRLAAGRPTGSARRCGASLPLRRSLV
jgi:hypothetical protein